MPTGAREAAQVVPAQRWQPFGVLDAGGCFVYLSAVATAVLGVEAKPLVGRRFIELLAADDRPRFAAALVEFGRSSGSGYPITASVVDAKGPGQPRLWRLTGLAGAGDSPATAVELLSVCETPTTQALAELPEPTDFHVLERDRAQDALLRKTAELQAILRTLPDLFFRFDADGCFIDFSAPSTSILYAPPELFLGKRPHEVMPPHIAAAMDDARTRAAATGALITHEYEFEVCGTLQQFEARYVPFLEDQTIAMVRTITERRQAEVALRASEARLRESQKIDAVGRLAGGVAHDFNNLLMIILGYTSSIALRIGRNHPAAPAVEEIRKAGERATALTKQLLALSRRQPMQPTALDLSEILHEMDSMLTRVIGENVQLATDVADEIRAVQADRSQIEQVVLNLVLNARDAMPKGGLLGVRAENVALEGDSARPVVDPRDATHVSLCVSDAGSGMDADTQARMFEPFFTTKAHGTGLGLFTVRHIVQEAGGLIQVSSRLREGTRIVVLLNAVDHVPKTRPSEPAGHLLGGNETVLVVEDEDAVRALVANLLRQLGYSVLAASDATDAIKRLRDHPGGIDLLLTDIVMPGMSGWELASEICRLRPGCRVLYMSGHAIGLEDGSVPRGSSDDLLLKPFTPAVLAARIREALTRPPVSLQDA